MKALKKGASLPSWTTSGAPSARHTDRDLVSGPAPDLIRERGAGRVREYRRRTTSAPNPPYLFGAICPREGKAAGLVLPFCNIDTVNLHLAEIARHLAPGVHAVLIMDQAGWHMTNKVAVPGDISIFPIPVKCFELNLQENV
ncbi:hypothetical protein [Sphingomonas trueperi]|uniref:hypothetical protein n=1 Tax=Sphingomonas trueperi TaxID=53317 RepID=UPI001C7C9E46